LPNHFRAEAELVGTVRIAPDMTLAIHGSRGSLGAYTIARINEGFLAL